MQVETEGSHVFASFFEKISSLHNLKRRPSIRLVLRLRTTGADTSHCRLGFAVAQGRHAPRVYTFSDQIVHGALGAFLREILVEVVVAAAVGVGAQLAPDAGVLAQRIG